MQWYEILVIVLAAAFVVGVGVWQIIRRKKGKVGCDCCSDCADCSRCKRGEEKGENGKIN